MLEQIVIGYIGGIVLALVINAYKVFQATRAKAEPTAAPVSSAVETSVTQTTVHPAAANEDSPTIKPALAA